MSATLTAEVGDIQHIKSQSLSGYGVVKDLLREEASKLRPRR